MVTNFVGPYELRITYTTTSLAHQMRINCDVVGVVSPGDPMSSITFQTRDTLTINAVTAITNFLTVIGAAYNTGTTFDIVELWHYPTPGGVPVFITAHTPGITGTSAAPTAVAHQGTFTWRTQEGGIMRLHVLESVFVGDGQYGYSGAGVLAQNIFDFVKAANSFILARDTSYPIASLRFSGGQNEALFRKIWR